MKKHFYFIFFVVEKMAKNAGEYEFLEKKGPRHALPLMKTQLHAKFQKN